MKIILIVCLCILLVAAIAVGFFAWRSASSRIGKDRALAIALEDAGLSRADVRDVEVDFEREYGLSFYELSFEQGFKDFEYRIDAASGEILSRNAD